MKVYQIIYTSVLHSLSDHELGLSNQSGIRVYSCSQGLERAEIDEITRFANYRLPKNNKIEYSDVVGDPSIPDKFPKTFRTLKLTDGKYAAIQASFAGKDHQGNDGNFFTHVFVFDGVDKDFFPERYFKSSSFRTHLTVQEMSKDLVKYLPVLEDLEVNKEFEDEIYKFIESHKKEFSYILNSTITMLMGGAVKNICISTSSEDETEKYVIGLKYLLPRDISTAGGVSTYNVYLPSDKQDRICIHGTIKGKNNITKDAIDTKESCMYVDMDKVDFSAYETSTLLEKWSATDLRKEYGKMSIHSVAGLMDWLSSYENINKQGMGGKLIKLKESVGDDAFANRARSVYEHINEEDFAEVKFEVTKVMYDNIDLFPEYVEELTKSYITLTMDNLAKGEKYDLGAVFSAIDNEKNQVAVMKKQIPEIMEKLSDSENKISDKNKFVLLGFFAQLKHKYGDDTWKDFFGGNRVHLTVFVEMAAEVIVTGYGIKPFSPPSNWIASDLDEMIAYFESSTEDEKLKNLCLKYIYTNNDTAWENYGITLTKHTKTRGEQEADMRTIHSMLKKVGYEPYQGGRYMDIKADVHSNLEKSMSPLLLTKLLDSYYRWQRTYGNQAQAKKMAIRFRAYLLEMKKTQRSCYDYIIPKLALEVIETPGHYHEIMVNSETMPLSFWNWFAIGYSKCRRDDDKLITYTRIYEASKNKLKVQIRKKLRPIFETK